MTDEDEEARQQRIWDHSLGVLEGMKSIYPQLKGSPEYADLSDEQFDAKIHKFIWFKFLLASDTPEQNYLLWKLPALKELYYSNGNVEEMSIRARNHKFWGGEDKKGEQKIMEIYGKYERHNRKPGWTRFEIWKEIDKDYEYVIKLQSQDLKQQKARIIEEEAKLKGKEVDPKKVTLRDLEQQKIKIIELEERLRIAEKDRISFYQSAKKYEKLLKKDENKEVTTTQRMTLNTTRISIIKGTK